MYGRLKSMFELPRFAPAHGLRMPHKQHEACVLRDGSRAIIRKSKLELSRCSPFYVDALRREHYRKKQICVREP